MVSISPRMIKNKFAVGVGFKIEWDNGYNVVVAVVVGFGNDVVFRRSWNGSG